MKQNMKKMKFICKGLTTIVVSILVVSCEKYLDVNENPNYPTDASPVTLLPSAEATTVAQLGWNGALIGNMWMQYTTQGNSTNQYNTYVNYQLTSASLNGFWANAYANTLPDLKFAIEKAEEEGTWDYWVIAKILTAYNFHILAEFYEDIPFTEALQVAKFSYPKYDDSKTVVYPGIISLLDEAIEKEAAAKATDNIISVDFFFDGDIDKWIAFAKSLKLKIWLRDFEANKASIQALLTAGGLLEEDCAFTAFEDATNKGNPLYEYNVRQLNTKENIRACHTFLEFLLVNNDPRIAEIYEITSAAQDSIRKGQTLTDRQKYEGLPCGTKPATTAPKLPVDTMNVPIVNSSLYKQSYSDPVYLMNEAETFFLVAEAEARLGDLSKAKTAYDKGVEAAFARWDFGASTFIQAGGVYAFDGSSTDAALKSILTQKWVAAAKANSWDAVFDRNRTGIPAISDAERVRLNNNKNSTLFPGYELGTLVAPGTTVLQPTEFPRRLLIPDVSALYNENAPKTKKLQQPAWGQVPDGK
jgi:hypothetical protein